MTVPLYNTLYDDEAALAQGCKEGVPQAQKALYDRYARQLMIICLRYSGNPHDAKDLLMEAMATCFKDIIGFEYRAEGSLQAWLKKITVNQCLMQLRKQRFLFRDLDDSIVGTIPEENEQDALARLSLKEMMAWIQELPPGYRTVFNLYVFEDMGHKDIACALGISESTSKSQLYKARIILKSRITQLQSIAL